MRNQAGLSGAQERRVYALPLAAQHLFVVGATSPARARTTGPEPPAPECRPRRSRLPPKTAAPGRSDPSRERPNRPRARPLPGRERPRGTRWTLPRPGEPGRSPVPARRWDPAVPFTAPTGSTGHVGSCRHLRSLGRGVAGLTSLNAARAAEAGQPVPLASRAIELYTRPA